MYKKRIYLEEEKEQEKKQKEKDRRKKKRMKVDSAGLRKKSL
jgi:hypothetical protein